MKDIHLCDQPNHSDRHGHAEQEIQRHCHSNIFSVDVKQLREYGNDGLKTQDTDSEKKMKLK